MLNINKKYQSSNFENVVIDVKYIILHCMCYDDKKALDFLCAQENDVSAHYYIADNGEVFNLVEDNKKAWHAGLSSWKNDEYLNSMSIGIELGNKGSLGEEDGYSKKQYKSLIMLLDYLQKKFSIEKDNILAHSDIAPDRKTDPGSNFNWDMLISNKLSIDFYKKSSNLDYIEHIYNFGYSRKYDSKNIIKAFQRRFISDNITGVIDSKTKKFINNCKVK